MSGKRHVEPDGSFARAWMRLLDTGATVETDLGHLDDEWFKKFDAALQDLSAGTTSFNVQIRGWQVSLERRRISYPDGDMPKPDYEFLPARRVRLLLCKRHGQYECKVVLHDVVWLKPKISL